MIRRLVMTVCAAAVMAGCGGDGFDRDAAFTAVGDERVVDAAETLCDGLDERGYQFAIAMAIDDGEDDLVAAALAGCPKKP